MSNQNDDILKKYFDSIKEENYKETFGNVENWLRGEAINSYNKPAKSKFTFFKYVFSEGRLKFAYLFIILIVAGVASNFSVTRTETVGSIMSWSVDKQNPEAIKKIDNLDWIDKSQLVVDQQSRDGKEMLTYKILLPTSNNEEIEKLKGELASIKDIQSINVIPISEPVKQPLYAVALEKVFKVDYNKNLVNPEEIKNNVFEQLKLAGIQDYISFNCPDNGSAGKFVNVNFGMQPDSMRIKVHRDIVYEYDLEKALDDVDELLEPVNVFNDSVLKKIVVRINGEDVNTDVIINEVYRNLDTLHLRLRNSDARRKEKLERFNERMERFNERMEKFNKNMEKYNKKMEKLNEKMKELNIPNEDFEIELNEEGDLNIDIDIDDIPEIPEVEKKNFNFNFKFDDLEKNIKISIDSINLHFDGAKIEKMNKKFEEKMKKFEEKMKNKKYFIDTSKIKIDIEYDNDEEENDNEDE
jgi:hypothetical protein